MPAMPQQEPGPRRPARPDASMSLLTTVMSHTLDEGYAAAAAGRRASGSAPLPRTLRARLWLAGGLLLAAAVVTLGAAQAREDAPAVARERAELLERVEADGARLDALDADIDALRDEVAALRDEALDDDGPGEDDVVALLAGETPVTGPGVEVTLDDAPDAARPGDSRVDGFTDTGRVRDRDLQRVVNGLWQARAEAISINGHRLTALTAIRAAGDAVLVDNRPLVPPYTVLAVGDPEALAAGLDGGLAGEYLRALHDEYGIRVNSGVRDDLALPAATSLATRVAVPAAAGGAAGEGNQQ
ncbi:DUF881 domain-containing protein [Streptomyces sp. RFCAC02]|uniref:DUF881 domain-containing protein n=1 Tax=Streptomyces sp. RFCAC02 TaxID=2499143 RepID=UPI00143DDBB3|nr:DUF881 domain-containing protein [Streptomyces sp. RFCAC02]